MLALYLLLGIALVALLHWTIQILTRMKTRHPRSYEKLMKAGGVLALAVLVSRLGLGRAMNALWLAGLFTSSPSAGKANPKTPPGEMSAQEARRILGVREGAGPDEIREAWRALMRHHHPDQGGSESLASQINQAKDVLLKK